MLVLTPDQIEVAAALLKNGEIVAFPTETVYGLGAPIFSEKSVAKIFEAKGRPADNPLIVHIADLSQVEQIAKEIPPEFYLLAEKFFPGPLTIVLKKQAAVPPIVSGGLDTIAFRMPRHPLAKALIEAVQEPLVAPSANLSGRPSSTTSEHVMQDFEGKIAAVLDGGATAYGIESTVIFLASDQPLLLRLGAVEKEEIEEVLKKEVVLSCGKESFSSPGTRYRHYAPKTPLRLFTEREKLEEYLSQGTARRLLLSTKEEVGFYELTTVNVYAWLRKADEERYEEIVVLCDERANRALVDRLYRAANMVKE
jgi:L-threonylcarbamoyladenylate synthase